ncbi:unnamed protein product [Arctogadus glacialis]
MKGPSRRSLLLSDWSITRNISLGFAATQSSYCTRQESGRIEWVVLSKQQLAPSTQMGVREICNAGNLQML